MPARKTLGNGESFWADVEKTDTCWLWTRGTLRSGYGRVAYGGKQYTTHRLAYELTYGPIPDDLFVCHHCDNPRCVRPDHLFLGTVRDNAIDMVQKGRHGTKGKTHCKHGHEFTPENTKVRRTNRGDLYRICVTCVRTNQARSNRRKAGEHKPYETMAAKKERHEAVCWYYDHGMTVDWLANWFRYRRGTIYGILRAGQSDMRLRDEAAEGWGAARRRREGTRPADGRGGCVRGGRE